MSPVDFTELKRVAYQRRLEAGMLRRLVYADVAIASAAQMEALHQAEKQLREAEAAVSAARPKDAGVVIDSHDEEKHLGLETTKLEAKVELLMEQMPTSIAHLMTVERDPLVSCKVRNRSTDTRRIRMVSYIEGYSAEAVDTFELKQNQLHPFKQLPGLYREAICDIDELTRATLHVCVDELGGEIEIEKTVPIWLLARTTAPLQVQNPSTLAWHTMYHYLGAYVTPNAPRVMAFMRKVAERHPSHELLGYRGGAMAVEPQVKAIYDALQKDAQISYVNSLVDFTPGVGASAQRVRLPSETLRDQQANCVDGAVLFASLLEAISLSPALVILPGHALVAWETSPRVGDWKHLDTTLLKNAAFQTAQDAAQAQVQAYAGELTRLPLRQLRADMGIYPME